MIISSNFFLEGCARYTIILFGGDGNQLDYALLTDIYPNGIHLAWQLIQIFVAACAEIFVSITGIAFGYSQGPKTMKAVCLSLWYIFSAFGNIIVIIVAQSSRLTTNETIEYLFFAGLLCIATLVFFVLTYFYKYREDYDNEEKGESIDKVATKKEGSSVEGSESGENGGKLNPMISVDDDDAVLVL